MSVNTETDSNFINNKICRTCLTENNLHSLCTNSSILNMLQTFTKLQIETCDNLPKTICSKCMNDIKYTYNFYNQCLESDQKLRKRSLSKSNVKDEKLGNNGVIEPEISLKIQDGEININKNDGVELKEEFSDNSNDYDDSFEFENTDSSENINENLDKKKVNNSKTKNSTDIKESGSNVEECFVKIENNEFFEDNSMKNEDNSSEDSQKKLSKRDYMSLKKSRSIKTRPRRRIHSIVKEIDDSENHMDEMVTTGEKKKRGRKKKIKVAENEIIQCEICGKIFKEPRNLQLHKRTHTGIRPFSCTECGKAFGRVDDLKRHKIVHTGEKNHFCSVCGKFYSQKSYLLIHQRIHNGEKPYGCSFCDKKFSCKNNMIKHQRMHTGEKFYCDVCGKGFSRNYNLKGHKAQHHPEQEESEYLESQSNATNDSSGADSQKISPPKVFKRPFPKPTIQCDVCGKIFKESRNLMLHSRTHTGERPFFCDVCGKQFARTDDLKRHKLIHSGTKLYSCPVCEKRFSQKGYLTIHQRIHSGEKPYSCSFCTKAFNCKNNLHKHLRTHTGERPYPCHACGKSFSRGHILKHHKCPQAANNKTENT